MAGAPGLLRYAARFAPSLEDAEDAYQRSMEIALTKGPLVDQQEFIAWLHVVLRNEATTLARKRTREAPADAEVVTAAVDRTHGGHDEPAAVMEWKERYRTLQDAMTSLNEAERVCLLLRTAGVSRAEIRGMTGYTERKVERSIVRGRERLNEWHHSMAAGEKCVKMREALERTGDEEATPGERRQVSRHVRHCAHCRATLRARRQSNAGLLVLVPVAIIATTAAAGTGVPDATAAMNVMDRTTAKMAVSIGQAWNSILDLPSLMSARVATGALAVTAGVAGVPLVAHQVQGGGSQNPAPITQTVQTSAAVVDPSATAPQVSDAQDLLVRLRAQAERERRALAARHREAQQRAAAERAAARAPAPAPTPQAAPASTPSPASSSGGSSSPQLEFGP
jgi:RNA polymerase sigma factor (sigma-70 family)